MRSVLLSIFCGLALTACAGNQTADTLTVDDKGIVRSEKFSLMWQQDKSKKFSSSSDAQKYVDALRLGGYSDWRIPTKAESHNLFFSLDFGSSNARELDMKMDGSIWVVMDKGALQAGAWDAGETCCIVRTFKKDDRGSVRAVRP
jgi:hypothetical protein